MKKLLLVIIGVLLGASIVSANSAPSKTSVITKFGVANQYLAFGNGAMLDEDVAAQALVLVLFPNGFNMSGWGTTNFKKWNSTLGSEIDFGVGWSGKVAEYVDLDVGVTYFDEPRVGTFGKGDIVYGRATLSRNILGVTTSFGYESYVTMPGSGIKGGDIYSIGASKKVSLRGDRASWSNMLALAYDDGGFGLAKGFLVRGTSTFDWKLSDRLTLTLPQVYYYLQNGKSNRPKNDTVVYGGVTYAY
jgi:hypothetical protein